MPSLYFKTFRNLSETNPYINVNIDGVKEHKSNSLLCHTALSLDHSLSIQEIGFFGVVISFMSQKSKHANHYFTLQQRVWPENLSSMPATVFKEGRFLVGCCSKEFGTVISSSPFHPKRISFVCTF